MARLQANRLEWSRQGGGDYRNYFRRVESPNFDYCLQGPVKSYRFKSIVIHTLHNLFQIKCKNDFSADNIHNFFLQTADALINLSLETV